MKDIEFWFSIGSTYSYLSVARLSALEHDTSVTFSWHPFSVRKLMQEMDNIPFPPTKKAKADYMWRDIESCLLYTSPSPRDLSTSRMPSSA